MSKRWGGRFTEGNISILKILRLDPVIRWFSLISVAFSWREFGSWRKGRSRAQWLGGSFLGEEVGTEIKRQTAAMHLYIYFNALNSVTVSDEKSEQAWGKKTMPLRAETRLGGWWDGDQAVGWCLLWVAWPRVCLRRQSHLLPSPLGSNFDMAPVCSLSSWASRVGRRGRLVQTVPGSLDTVHPSPMLALFGRAATGKIKVQRNQALFVGWLTFWSLPEFYI